MKILHISLHYIDGWGYQDNLLPLYQVDAGHDVVVAADWEHLPAGQRKSIEEKGDRYPDDGVMVRRFHTSLCTSDSALCCQGLMKILEEESPDLVFHHGIHFPTLLVASRYRRRHPDSVLMADSHADPFNVSRNRIWRKFYSEGLLRLLVRKTRKQVDRYYGVTPLRCEFLETEFRVPKEKIALLPLAGDSRFLQEIPENIAEIRATYSIPDRAFLLVTGGRMGRSKGTDRVIDAWQRLRERFPDMELLLFGSLEPGFQVPEGVHLLGWCDRVTTCAVLKMADVAVWPLFHTTLVEDALVYGTPVIVKDSGNVSHHKAAGVCVTLETGDTGEIVDAVRTILEEKSVIHSKLQSYSHLCSYEQVVSRIGADYWHIKKA